MRVDFHVHTEVSDGRYPPEEVWEKACAARLRYLSIADHDAVSGALAVRDLASDGEGPTLLCAVEHSVRHDETESHVLGYYPDGPSDDLLAFLEDVQAERRERLEVACEGLREAGVAVEASDVEEEVTGPVVSRSHLAATLVRLNRVSSHGEAFRRFLAQRHGIVPFPAVDAPGIVERIAGWGGVSVWAHPPLEGIEDRLPPLVEAGLDGIEAYHPRFRSKDRRTILDLADRHDLLVSAGSDWHGHRRQGNLKGVSVGLDRIGSFLERVGLGLE